MGIEEAFQMALESLRAEAFAGHSARLEASYAAHPEGLMVTSDMCPCGMTTGADSDEKCEAVRMLLGVRFTATADGTTRKD
jgi:hypothetical protein